MKRIITLLYICIVSLVAVAQNVTLSFKNTPLAEALKSIDQAQADKRVHFVFDDLENLQVTKTIKNKSAFEAVKAVCAKQPVGVEMKGSDIFVEADVKADSTRRINIVGKVIDGFLEIGLPDVQVSLLDADRNVLVDSMTTAYIQGAHNSLLYTHFYTDVPAARRNYIVRASMDGYIDVEQPVSVTDLTKDKVELPTLKMRKDNSVMLRDVTVSATRIKMFWRGDTLVYDATAFKLPEGSMLDDLIRQMPGVRMNDAGEIFVNERKVDELLLGSRSFMKGNRKVLLENLPYYTVKDIKVYEKTSDMSIALGRDLGDKSYVMDVNLKQEYQHGYIGNMEAAAGTEERWLGRAFLLAFTDRWRYTVHANSNNVNEGRHIGESDNWSPSRMAQNMQTTRSVAAEANYVSKSRNVKSITTAEFQDNDITTDMRQRRETFLNGLTPHSNSEATTKRDFQFMKVSEEVRLLKPFWLNVQSELVRTRTDNHTNTAFSQYTDSLTTSMLTTSLDKATSLYGSVYAQGAGCINKQKNLDIGGFFLAEFNNSDIERAQRYNLQQFVNPASSSRTYNVGDVNSHSKTCSTDIFIRRPFAKRWSFYSKAGYKYKDKSAHDFLYHPDTLTLPSQLDGLRAFIDPRNSYDSHYTKHGESLSISLTNNKVTELMPGYNLVSERFNINLDFPLQQQRLAYQRGAIDTVACHNSF